MVRLRWVAAALLTDGHFTCKSLRGRALLDPTMNRRRDGGDFFDFPAFSGVNLRAGRAV
jgi:hypothetical protein